MFDLPADAPAVLARTVNRDARSIPSFARVVWLIAEAECSRRVLRRLVPGDRVVVGTSPSCDVVLESAPGVSPRHCQLVHTGAAIRVEDLGSEEGVFVGVTRLHHGEVTPGARLRLGRTILHLALDGSNDGEDEPPLPTLIGTSSPMRRLAARVRRVAPLTLPALVRGESGSGKELVARALHEQSRRARGPFVALNAAAISRELAESELFGHERGAFTGAQRERRGAFREAHGGTLFLDEIGALSLEIQAKLLRVVEEGLVRPLGSERAHRVDVRVVVATCEPLEDMVVTRQFRADLYERLAACVVTVPALRDRPGDLPQLARHLLDASGLAECVPTPNALALLAELPLPGNVRELRNLLVQAALRGHGSIDVSHVHEVLEERRTPMRRRVDPEAAVRILEQAGGNVSAAARAADLPRSTLRSLLRAADKRREQRPFLAA